MSALEIRDRIRGVRQERVNELENAHQLALKNAHSEYSAYLCRSWMVFAFAHCEGFLKYATEQCFLETLRVRPDPDHLRSLWLLLHKDDPLALVDEKSKFKTLHDLRSAGASSLFGHPERDKMFKKGGFDFKLLKFICEWVLRIRYDYSNQQDFILRLKTKRNAIAHGDGSLFPVERDDFEGLMTKEFKECLNLHDKAVQFINEFGDAICDKLSELEPGRGA